MPAEWGAAPRPPLSTVHRPARRGETHLIDIKHKTTGAVLHQIDARRLDKANLAGLSLRCADLSGQVFTRSILKSADLCEADLSFANLAEADLENAVLFRANLGCAMMISARLGGADLREANLRNASLYQADVHDAQFNGAILLGTDLTGVDLTGAQFHLAVYDARTRWPDGFDATLSGAVLKA